MTRRPVAGAGYLAAVALLTAIYFASAKLGLLAAVAQRVVSSAWPAAGLALAALLLFGLRLWPGIALGAFLLNASSGVSIAGAAGIAAGNTLEAVVGATLLARVAGFRTSLERLRDVLALVLLAALGSTVLSATVGVSSLWLSGAISPDRYGLLWLVWWTGDAMGVLVFTPLFLTWATKPRFRLSPERKFEAAALLLALVLLTRLFFQSPFSYVYAIFPAASWAALRFGPRGAATAAFLVSGLAVWYTVQGLGPFVASTPTENLFLLQTFMALLTLTVLILAAVMAEQKRAEKKFSGLLEAAPDAMVIAGQDGRIVLVNAQAEAMFGYTRAELLGRPVDILAPDAIREAHAGHRAGYFRDPRTRPMGRGLDLSGKRKDGSEFPTEISLSPMETGEGILVTAAIRDITSRKQLEEQLRLSQRLEAVGFLAAGVAHDFNNLLTTIMGHGQLLLLHPGAGEPQREAVQEVLGAAERAATLTSQLLAFSRRQILEPKVMDLNGVVVDMDKMLRPLIGPHIDLVVRLEPALGRVKADPGQMEQVILNLVVNARDAMPGGGKLMIETANVELDGGYAEHHVAVRPGPCVLLAVSDTGVGMDAVTRAHIFEPFFTTKAKGRGTGLGLATVYGIAKQSGGNIWVYSEPGRGSTFKMYLPRVAEAIDPQTTGAAAGDSPRGSETILLVEDEESVRRVTRQILQNNGYTILQAKDGDEAVGIAGTYTMPIHLILTDVVLPRVDGRALAERLALARPGMRVLYMSGYTDTAIVHHGVLASGVAFLQKPFSAGALTRKVREVLDRPLDNIG